MSQVSLSIFAEIAEALAPQQHQKIKISNVEPISGGDINDAYRFDANNSTLFVKVNTLSLLKMLKTEAKGLELLQSQSPFKVPAVVGVFGLKEKACMVIDFVQTAPKADYYWANFGRSLASMHQCTASAYGLDHNNYIGSLPQDNTQMETWEDFFINKRLIPLISLASTKGLLEVSEVEAFMPMIKEISNGLFPTELPALLHGDLWSGNLMTNERGQPVLIDPAVYYGHREMDLAMTQLFGGFNKDYFYAYHEKYPLEKGWQQRLELCNVYPLLVHLILFGRNYWTQIKEVLRKF